MVSLATRSNARIPSKPSAHGLDAHRSIHHNAPRRTTLLWEEKPRSRAQTILFVLLLMLFSLVGTSFAQPTNLSTDREALPAAGKSTLPAVVREGSAPLVAHYPAKQMLRVAFAMRPPHMVEEEQLLESLRTPGSLEFRKFLTPEEWNDRFAPSIEDEQAVVEWAQSQGLTITQRYPSRLIVDVEAPAETMERAFNVQINRYQRLDTTGEPTFFSNDREVQLPNNISSVLSAVLGLDSFNQPVRASSQQAGAPRPDYLPGPVWQEGESAQKAGDGSWKPGGLNVPYVDTAESAAANLPPGYIDPRELYNAASYNYDGLQNLGHCCNPLGNPKNSPPDSSIAIYLGNDFLMTDVANFESWFPYLSYNVEKVYIDGFAPCCAVGEPFLDVEWATATANSFGDPVNTAKIYAYEYSGSGGNGPADVYAQMLTDNKARVMSTSYPFLEPAANAAHPFLDSLHAIFNQMAGQGWTLVAASGDQGATANCQSKSVWFPASDPNFVGVGGTELNVFQDVLQSSEIAWTGSTAPGSCNINNNQGGSTGGCSVVYAAPGYQSNPVCGKGSRSVPDVALNAFYGVYVSANGNVARLGGTSAAAPEMAGFFAQENAYLLSLGNQCGGTACAPLGNPDPALYAIGHKTYQPQHYPFYDITSGCNNNDIANASTGFYCAGPGYDLVTGWGSMNMLQMAWALNGWVTGNTTPKAPSFTIQQFNAGWTNDSTASIQWSVSSNASNSSASPTGIAGVSTAFDNEAPVRDAWLGSRITPKVDPAYFTGPAQPGQTDGSATFSSQGQGCHIYYFNAWDNDGGTTGPIASNKVCFDSIAPQSNASVSPQPNSSGWSTYPVQVTLTAVDPGASTGTGSRVKTIYYAVDQPACTASATATCSIYPGAAVQVTSSAIHTFTYFSADLAGNLEPAHTFTFNIDTVPPITAGRLQAGTGGNLETLVFSATDNLSGVAATYYSLDGGALTTYTGPIHFDSIGAHSVRYYSVDKAGNQEAARTDPFVISSLPVITGLNPNVVKAGSGSFTLIVNGTGFTPGTAGSWNSTVVNTDYVSPTEVLMGIPASLDAAPGTAKVTVTTSPGQSLPAALTVTAPTPVITSLSPNPVIAGGPTFWLTIHGTNFAPGDYVWVNTAVSPVVKYVSPSEMQVEISYASIEFPGTLSISAGPYYQARSAPATLTITVPTITGISPNRVVAGGPTFTLTIYGQSFAPGDYVWWNNTVLPVTTYISSTEMQVQISYENIAAPGTAGITVGPYYQARSIPATINITGS
jgi:hypothetical protein